MSKQKRINVRFIDIVGDPDFYWTSPELYPEGEGLYFVRIANEKDTDSYNTFIILYDGTAPAYLAGVSDMNVDRLESLMVNTDEADQVAEHFEHPINEPPSFDLERPVGEFILGDPKPIQLEIKDLALLLASALAPKTAVELG